MIAIRSIAVASIVLAIGLISAIVFFMGDDVQVVAEYASRTGIAITIVGLFWALYSRILWRLPVFRLLGSTTPMPDLRGRWVGTVQRDVGDAVPRTFVLEIGQSFGRMNFRTYTRNSEGRSLGVWHDSAEGDEFVDITAVWRTETNSLNGANRESFLGSSIWRLEKIRDSEKFRKANLRIVDHYYTQRKTRGVLYLQHVSTRRTNSFEGAGVPAVTGRANDQVPAAS